MSNDVIDYDESNARLVSPTGVEICKTLEWTQGEGNVSAFSLEGGKLSWDFHGCESNDLETANYEGGSIFKDEDGNYWPECAVSVIDEDGNVVHQGENIGPLDIGCMDRAIKAAFTQQIKELREKAQRDASAPRPRGA